MAISMSLAKRAYYQFGFRPESEANSLITRKFMRDLLMEFKDLRATDANNIIDVALPLSFLPTVVHREMKEYTRTFVYQQRSAEIPECGWIDWLLLRVRKTVIGQP